MITTNNINNNNERKEATYLMTKEQVERTIRAITYERKKICDAILNHINKVHTTTSTTETLNTIADSTFISITDCTVYKAALRRMCEKFNQFYTNEELVWFKKNLESIARLVAHYEAEKQARETRRANLMADIENLF